MLQLHRESFPVHGYDVDAFRLLPVPALAGYLQEVATHHAEALGVGVDALRARGLTWVLGRQRLEVPLPIRLGDQLEIETWPSGTERLGALRDFRVRNQRGEEVARAITSWFVMDLDTRRPVRPDRVLDPRLQLPQAHALPPGERLAPLPDHQREQRFHIRYQDIDENLHVTNTSYLCWALEAVAPGTWREARAAAVEADYLAECRHGSRVLSRLRSEPDGAFGHAVLREEDGKELCRLRTRWVARQG